jgi:hypothetical protein
VSDRKLPIGSRVLAVISESAYERQWADTVCEVVLLEQSPSGGRVKVKYVSGATPWEKAAHIRVIEVLASGLTLSPEGGRPGLYDKPSPLIQHMDSCWHCRHSGTYCAAGLRLLNTQAKDSAPRPEALEAIRKALSEDGVNADDVPMHVTVDSDAAEAWVAGYEAGQNSVQRHLDAFKPLSRPSGEERKPA